jgi:hypothetical protein
VHRNTYVNAPKRLERLEVATRPGRRDQGSSSRARWRVSKAMWSRQPWAGSRGSPPPFAPGPGSRRGRLRPRHMGRYCIISSRLTPVSERALRDFDPFARRIHAARSA